MSLHFFTELHTMVMPWMPTDKQALAMIGLCITVLFGLRTAVILVMRGLGLYHINHFSRWPCLPWRPLWRAWIVIAEWWQEVFTFGKRSTAGFTTIISVFSMMYSAGLIPLGRVYCFGIGLLMPVGIKTQRHLMAIAMTGSGKTVFLTLLVSIWRSSVFIIDPQSKITRFSSKKSKKRWHVIAPYDKDLSSACWNFFDEIKAAENRQGADAAVTMVEKICEALIVSKPTERDPFFTSSARGLYSSVFLHVRTTYPEACHNPCFVYQLICRGCWEKTADPEAAFDLLLNDMLNNKAYDGAIANRASAVADAGKVTRGNILATARDQTKWLGLPELKTILTTSTFSCEELKKFDDIVVSFAAPVGAIRSHLAGFTRVLTNITSFTFESISGNKQTPCLFAVDEMQAQGYNEYIEQMAPVMRSYGIQFFGIVQDIEGLEKAYPQSWQGFIGNAEAVYWCASNHQGTLEYLCKILGKKSRSQKISGTHRRVENERDVMTPEQLRRFLNADKENLIVTRAGARPLKLKLLKYYSDLPITHYSPDPDHKEVLLKRMSRRVMNFMNAD